MDRLFTIEGNQLIVEHELNANIGLNAIINSKSAEPAGD